MLSCIFSYLFQQPENNVCGDGHLSGIMPDVAMATASFGALQLVEQQELELDLGDGTSHLLQHGPVSIGTVGPHHPLFPHQRQRHFPGPPPPAYMYHRSSSGLPRFIWASYTRRVSRLARKRRLTNEQPISCLPIYCNSFARLWTKFM